jgi:SEC-C motif-containing protein
MSHRPTPESVDARHHHIPYRGITLTNVIALKGRTLMDPCPCGSKKTYQACCEPLHSGHEAAQSAEALMRARYSAYVKAQVAFILETTHPSQRDQYTDQGIRRWARNSEWRGLTILATEDGTAGDDTGTVEFVAEYFDKGRRQRHHEIAQFRRLEGTWYFYDGQAPAPQTVVRSTPKVGRNAPCPCGSGRKFKKCCAA